MRPRKVALLIGIGLFTFGTLLVLTYFMGYAKGVRKGEKRQAEYAVGETRSHFITAAAIRRGDTARALRSAELRMWAGILPTHHLLEESKEAKATSQQNLRVERIARRLGLIDLQRKLGIPPEKRLFQESSEDYGRPVLYSNILQHLSEYFSEHPPPVVRTQPALTAEQLKFDERRKEVLERYLVTEDSAQQVAPLEPPPPRLRSDAPGDRTLDSLLAPDSGGGW